ncbi:MAG: HAD family phosphatase [Paludibacter sp.]|nr:HAD family phosphatase [Paludibacter sp.]MDD4199376.1 HAD family phosphatase [Paludibacter sp.]MDD4427062.1 HAD family phosphatase [Paludibacter sp.]
MIVPDNISTLIFDFGGVIYNIDIQLGISNLKKIGFADADKYIGHFGHNDFFIQWENGGINVEKFRNEIRKRCVKEVTDQEIDDAWCSIMLNIPEERIKLLQQLRKKYRLLLLSNTNPLHISVSTKEELGKRGLSMGDLFDKCYYSYEVGAIKPGKEIFLHLLQDDAVKAENCLFLDDGKKNIETATGLGFNTYLVTPGQSLDFLL